jgi:hypothetical protein
VPRKTYNSIILFKLIQRCILCYRQCVTFKTCLILILSQKCFETFKISELKGSVQRKLRWVENGVNRSVGASDCGAGHSFVVLFRFHLDFTIFPFPVSTAEFIGESWKNKRSATSDVAPIVLELYRIRYWRYVDSCA